MWHVLGARGTGLPNGCRAIWHGAALTFGGRHDPWAQQHGKDTCSTCKDGALRHKKQGDWCCSILTPLKLR